MSELNHPIPAATLILMRPGTSAPELLVIERTHTMAFAAGAMVFPGGRIDPGDHVLADRVAPGDPCAPAKIAAIRETIEETGLAPAFDRRAGADAINAIRAGLERGEAFESLLDRHGIGLDLDALTPFARWCPNFKEARRFDTLFFLAEAPDDAADAIAAEAEAMRAFWATAGEVLEEANSGRSRIIFPTRRNLERLARFASIDEARADAARHPVRKVVPWVEERDGRQWLCIPDDLGYPVTAELLETARRT